MFERFTEPARRVVLAARAQARELGQPRVGTEHLLLALLAAEGDGTSAILHSVGLTADRVMADLRRILGDGGVIGDEDAAALRQIGIDIDAVRARLEESFGPGALDSPASETRRGLFGRRAAAGHFSPRSKKVLELSLREALRLRQRFIGTEHILLGLIREGQGLAAKLMTQAGVDLSALRRATEESLRRAA